MLDVNKVEKWYKQGLWTKEMMMKAVEKGTLSKEDYEKIVGEPYPTES